MIWKFWLTRILEYFSLLQIVCMLVHRDDIIALQAECSVLHDGNIYSANILLGEVCETASLDPDDGDERSNYQSIMIKRAQEREFERCPSESGTYDLHL